MPTKKLYPINAGNFTQLNVLDTATVAKLLTVERDATILDDMLIKGGLIIEGPLTMGSGSALTLNDATIKDSLRVEGFVYSPRYEYDQIVVIDTTVREDMHVGRRLFVEESSEMGDAEIQNANIHRDLIVQDDATVKDTLIVERLIEAQNAHVHHRLMVQDDATVRNNLRVEGYIGGASPVKISGGMEVAGASTTMEVSGDVLIRDDATVKDYLVVERLIEVPDIHIHKDLVVQDDATVKGDLYIGDRQLRQNGTRLLLNAGRFSVVTPAGAGECSLYLNNGAEVGDAYIRLNSGDIWAAGVDNSDGDRFKIARASDLGAGGDALWAETWRDVGINKSLIVRDDATVKGDLRVGGRPFVEDDRAGGYGTAAGITDDFTTQGMVFRVVKGLIVKAAYKSG